MKKYVYLKKDENRLVITSQNLDEDNNYRFFIFVENDDEDVVNKACQVFCMGYICGSQNEKPVNELHEFN